MITYIYRYTDQYVLQLAVIASSKKPKDLDSFLAPIITELKDLATHGILVRRNNREEICRAKVHLMLAAGDMPAVAQMAHVSSHSGRFGCRICEVQGKHPLNATAGMYFVETNAPFKNIERLPARKHSKYTDVHKSHNNSYLHR
jgi:hypothetical protein